MREILWQIVELNKEQPSWDVLGYVDRQPSTSHGCPDIQVGGACCPYLGDDSYLLSGQAAANVAITVGEPGLRKKIAENLKKNQNIHFPNLILGNAKICSDVGMGQGCIVSMDCRVSTNVVLGDFVFLNIGAVVCHDGRIGSYTTLSPGARTAGQVAVGQLCELGMGANVIQGIQIGNNAIAGAGSVVVKDVEGGCTVAGVPARRIK